MKKSRKRNKKKKKKKNLIFKIAKISTFKVLTFGADMSSSGDVDNKERYLNSW